MPLLYYYLILHRIRPLWYLIRRCWSDINGWRCSSVRGPRRSLTSLPSKSAHTCAPSPCLPHASTHRTVIHHTYRNSRERSEDSRARRQCLCWTPCLHRLLSSDGECRGVVLTSYSIAACRNRLTLFAWNAQRGGSWSWKCLIDVVVAAESFQLVDIVPIRPEGLRLEIGTWV